jgi:hypothetical protein
MRELNATSTSSFSILAGLIVIVTGSSLGSVFSSGDTGPAAPVGRWIERTPPPGQSAGPKGAEDCATIYDPVRGRVIVYGGKDDADQNGSEAWAFDPAERVWAQLKTSGPRPPSSEDHTAIYDPIGDRLILHGGENGLTSNKLWSLDLKSLTWRDLTSPDVPRRESHSAVYDSRGKRMVIFGGFDRTTVDVHEVWAMDLDPGSPTFEKWQNLSVAEGRPPGRIDHSAVYDINKNRMVFHGGWTKARKAFFGDTWAFSFADAAGGKGRWAKLDTTMSAPPARRHGVAVHDPDRNQYVMFGGQGHDGFLNDTWAFDLTNDVWVKVATEASPAARIDHQAVYDTRTHSIFVYGGDGGVPHKKLHDVWELTFQSASQSEFPHINLIVGR